MPARFPVMLADGPERRASAVRPLLDAAGWPSQPLRGEPTGPALVLVDPDHPQRAQLLGRAASAVHALVVPEDRALIPALEEAVLGLGLPDAEVASRVATIASELATADDVDDLVRMVALRARELIEAEAASVLLVDADTNDLVFRANRGGSESSLLDVRVPAGRGIAGWVIQNRRPAVVNDVEHDPRHYAELNGREGFRPRNLIALPLFWRGDIVGVLEVLNREGGFSDREATALGALAPHLGIALNHTRSALALRASAAAAARRTQDLESSVRERTRVIAKGKAEWEQTFDAIDEPMAILDGFVVRRANRAYAERAGLPLVRVPGITCYQALGRSAPCTGCPRTLNRPSGEIQVTGGRTEFMARHELRDGGEVVRYRDVTVERALESKLRESDRRAAVVQLAAGAAHEINNPIGFVKANLATLSGYVEDLARLGSQLENAAELSRATKPRQVAALLEQVRSTLDPSGVAGLATDAADLIRESQQGLQRVADIIRALKALSNEESSATPGRAELVATTELALREVRGTFPSKAVGWLSRDACWVDANPFRLQQAVAAIATNGFQASESSAVEGIHLSVESVGNEARLRILDRGPGIAPSIRPRVFEPFFTTRGVGGGVGLGLTAAYGIVTRYGGRVELNPRHGGGTEAVIVLPLSAAQTDGLAAAVGS